MRTKYPRLAVLVVACLLGGFPPPPPVFSQTETAPPAESTSPSTIGTESINELLRRTMDDPRTAERRRQILKATVKRIYTEFTKERRLAPDQASEVIELLTDREMIDLQDSTSFLAGDPDDASSPKSIARLASIAWTETYQKLRTLLSESGYAHFQDYEKTVSERVALAEISQELAMNSEPLSDEQINFLFQVLSEERQRTPPLAFDPRGPGSYRERSHIAIEGEKAARYFETQAKIDQRVLARAKAVLSRDQYEALQTFQRQYLETERSGIELARKITRKSVAP